MPTDDNVADPHTKVLSQSKFEHYLESMGIRYVGVIGSRSSGRLLEICPRAIVVITIIHVYVIFKTINKSIYSLYYAMFNYMCL